MLKVCCLLGVVATLLLAQSSVAQDDLSKMKIFLDPIASPHGKKDVGKGVELFLKKEAASARQPDLLDYLSEKQGRIPVYSGMQGSVQLEVGIAGYFGIKYRF